MSELYPFTQLSDVAGISMGQAPDGGQVGEFGGRGVAFIQGSGEFGIKHPVSRLRCLNPPRIGKKHSVLVSVRAPVGDTNVADIDYCIGRGLAAVEFTQYATTVGRAVLDRFGTALQQVAQGTTFAAIGKSDLLSLPVPAIPSRDARAIARILDTLDTQIEKTQALIAKLEQVKEGLLHDLLTRGVDENGELRPSPEEAPKLYKASPLGLIPRGWEAISLKSVIQHTIDFRGRTPRKLGMDWGGGDILALSANNVQPGRIDTSREAYFGSEALYQRWMTNGCTQKGDVLLTMEAPLGNIAQIPDDAKYILSQRVIALRFDPAQLLNDFAFWQMQSAEFQSSMTLRSTGTTATGLQRAELVKLPVKVPPIAEQSIATELLFSMSSRAGKERIHLGKLIQEKNGLMDDLLTGRVRVTPLLDPQEAPATV